MNDQPRRNSQVRYIDILPFRDPVLRTFAGHDRGRAAHAWARLNQVDSDLTVDLVVVIQIPEDTWDVGSGFWLGMFGESVRRLGPDRFRTRYRFRGGIPETDVEATIEDPLLEEEHGARGPLRSPVGPPHRDQGQG